jgi:hypothetical protein
VDTIGVSIESARENSFRRFGEYEVGDEKLLLRLAFPLPGSSFISAYIVSHRTPRPAAFTKLVNLPNEQRT